MTRKFGYDSLAFPKALSFFLRDKILPGTIQAPKTQMNNISSLTHAYRSQTPPHT